MRFLADMGVSMIVVEWLRTNGHNATHLREEGLHRLPNGEIFRKAATEDRIVVTFDLDFGEIISTTDENRTSVILFRLRDTRNDNVIRRLTSVFNDIGSELLDKRIIVIEEFRYRIREFPPTSASRNPSAP